MPTMAAFIHEQAAIDRALELQVAETTGRRYGVEFDPWKSPWRFRVIRYAVGERVPELGERLPGDCRCVFVAKRETQLVLVRAEAEEPAEVKRQPASKPRRRVPAQPLRQCRGCGNLFQPYHPVQAFCSSSHCRYLKARSKREAAAAR